MKTGQFIVSLFACILVFSLSHTSTYAVSSSKKIDGVPAINQYPELPSGCEATAVTMLLQWANVQVSKEEVADKIPKEPLPWLQDGKLWGGNPYIGFIGDPFSDSGFGVFSQPMVQVINQYLPDRAQSLTGSPFEDILATVDSGRPVVVWTTIGLQEPTLDSTWTAQNGGEIVWNVPEHAMTLIGFDDSNVIVNDPSTGGAKKYSRTLFKQRYEQMGSHAVTITKPPTASTANANTQKPKITILLNGQNVKFTDAYPMEEYDRTFVPIRTLSEQMGYQVQWIQEEQRAVFKNEKNTVEITIGDNVALVNGKKVPMDTDPNIKAEMLADHTYVPLRFVSENLNCRVDWENKNQELFVYITRPNSN